MNDLSPLLASSEDELELALLRSVDGDEPSAGALSKTALALGVGAALIGTAATAGGTLASASATHVAGGALGKHTGLTLFSVLKWLAAGAGAGLIASSAAHFAFRGAAAPLPAQRAVTAPVALEARPAGKTASHSPPPAPQATLVAPAAGPTTEAVASPRITPVPPESNTPAAGVAPALPTTTASSASFEPLSPAPGALAAPPASTSQLTEETQALDRVRTLLEAKRPREALAELERFRKRWPAAALRAEAAVLRVEALLRLGDRASAEREADTLVRVAPHSRHAQRVRELLAR
jgi:hypothetical protein